MNRNDKITFKKLHLHFSVINVQGATLKG